MEIVMGTVRAVRSLRAELGLPPALRLPVQFRATEERAAALRDVAAYVASLAKTEEPVVGVLNAARPLGSVTILFQGVEISVPLAGLVDPARERDRIGAALLDLEADSGRLQARLGSEEFVRRAPAEVVERDRARASELEERRARLREILDALG